MAVNVSSQRYYTKGDFLDAGMHVADMTEFDNTKFEGCIKYVESEKKYMGYVNGNNVDLTGGTPVAFNKTINVGSWRAAGGDNYTVTILATEHKLSVIPKEMVEVRSVGGTELYRVVTVDTNNNITVQISTTDGNQPDETVKITILGWN